MKTADLIQNFIADSRAYGYDIGPSIFRADYNGKDWSVGFWIRPAKYSKKDDEYTLPGRCGKAKNKNFRKAVKAAIKEAKRFEHG